MAIRQQLELPVPKRITEDAVVKASAGKIWAIQLNGGTDASSLKFHNHASSATGTQLIEVVAPFTAADASAQAPCSLVMLTLAVFRFQPVSIVIGQGPTP